MAVMTASTWLPRGRAFTVGDLNALPDDGNRYELIDGALIVTPSPRPRHQIVSMNLSALLHRLCPPHLRVLTAPLDVRLDEDTTVQPDVLVTRRSDLTESHLPVAPVLAVEILSPSTRTIDLHSKRDRLRRAGCPSYWVIDPDDGHLTAWDLDDQGQYIQVADLSADETWTATRPFPVTVVPRDLLD